MECSNQVCSAHESLTKHQEIIDEKYTNLLVNIETNNVLLKQVHEAVLGNGKPGLKSEIETFKGSLSTFKWIVGSGSLFAITAIIITIVNIL